ncbi:type II toxin-antitoxin system RelE/ParE family toxin [Roseateles sp. DXS20W]|uniref:Type II toxin-antitoxin system RelE/ParE family toxin n=1 Tax=Pelomonas lactea TaxID=3299030 RepID=A0ABW7GPC4_9BURK
MRVLFRPEARAELFDAQDWYEARAPGLGREFARVFEAALQAACRQPAGFAEAEEGCRRVVLRRFPYSLYYRATDDELLVVAVFHHRRPPSARVGRR